MDEQELIKLFLDYRARILKGESCDLRKDYIAKAIPLISAEARKQLVPDGCENVGVEYRFYPGGVECVLTYRTEVGFEEAKAFIEAPMNYYDRQSFAVEAMKQALKEGGKEAE